MTVEEAAGIGQIHIADLAFDGERGQGPAVMRVLGKPMRHGEVADIFFVRKDAISLFVLRHHHWRHGPILVEIDAQRSASAVGVDVVVIVLRHIVVVVEDAGEGVEARASQRRAQDRRMDGHDGLEASWRVVEEHDLLVLVVELFENRHQLRSKEDGAGASLTRKPPGSVGRRA